MRLYTIVITCALFFLKDAQGITKTFECSELKDVYFSNLDETSHRIYEASRLQSYPFNRAYKLYDTAFGQRQIKMCGFYSKTTSPQESPYAEFVTIQSESFSKNDTKALLEYTAHNIEPKILKFPFNNNGRNDYIIYHQFFSWMINSTDYIPNEQNEWPYRILGFLDTNHLCWVRASECLQDRYTSHLWDNAQMMHFRNIVRLLEKCHLTSGSAMSMERYSSIFMNQERAHELMELAQSTLSLLDSLDRDNLPHRFSYAIVFAMIYPIIHQAELTQDIWQSLNACAQRVKKLTNGNRIYDNSERTPFDHLFYEKFPKAFSLELTPVNE